MEIKYIKDLDELTENSKLKEALDKFEEKRNAPRSQAYYDMMDNHSKALKDIADEAGPWEWEYGLDLFVEHLRWMKDYYTINENVWCEDHNRLETITKALEYYDKWQSVEDEYITVVDHPETYKTTDNGDGTVTVNSFGFHCEYKCGSMKRTYRKIAKLQKKYKKLFFKTVLENMESWWD